MMKSLVARFKKFKNDEGGMEFIQVAAIALLAIALIAAIVILGNNISTAITNAGTTVENGLKVDLEINKKTP